MIAVHRMWYLLGILAVLYGVACLFLYLSQRSFVFSPQHELLLTLDDLDYPSEEAFVPVNDLERIQLWYFPVDRAAATVIFFQGNAGNLSHRISTVEMLRSLGASALLVSYRGYAQSDGEPSEKNVYEDARTAYDWLRARNISADQIVIFGRSLGGAVAVDLATHVPCRSLIVESSFTSALDLGQGSFPYFPIRLMLRYRFDSLHKIGGVPCPVLITHSPDDDMIPYNMGRKLFAAAPEPKRFYKLQGRHNAREYQQDEAYLAVLREFLFNPPRTGAGPS